MLSRRLASAAVIILVLIALISVDFFLGRDETLGRPGLIVALIAVVVGMLSTQELGSLFRHRQPDLNVVPLILISGVAVAICCAPVLWRSYPQDCAVGMFGWMAMAFTV